MSNATPADLWGRHEMRVLSVYLRPRVSGRFRACPRACDRSISKPVRYSTEIREVVCQSAPFFGISSRFTFVWLVSSKQSGSDGLASPRSIPLRFLLQDWTQAIPDSVEAIRTGQSYSIEPKQTLICLLSKFISFKSIQTQYSHVVLRSCVELKVNSETPPQICVSL